MNNFNQYFMRIALNLAKKGVGMVSPNPAVGAVVVKGEKIIGRGYHKKYGGPHAEVFALEGLKKEDLEGATLFVTLEPCAHFGKTPPCANLIIEKGIKKVVIGIRDKNPLVSGKGIDLLKKNGVQIVEGVLEEELKKFYSPFFKFISEKRPFVTLKIAQSFDGKNSVDEGSKYLVSERTLKYVHRLRYESDAIMVGVNTVIFDNPALDIRYFNKKKDLLKVILDTNGRIRGDERIFNSRGDVLIYTANKSLLTKKLRAEIEIANKDGDKLDLNYILSDLAKKKIQNLLVEGGSTLSFEIIKKGLVDRLVLIIAPLIIGGEKYPSFGGEGFRNLKDAFFLKDYCLKRIDRDIILQWEKF